jgi:hypothetical protein
MEMIESKGQMYGPGPGGCRHISFPSLDLDWNGHCFTNVAHNVRVSPSKQLLWNIGDIEMQEESRLHCLRFFMEYIPFYSLEKTKKAQRLISHSRPIVNP